jgi:23S rRNA (uridine2552-2'-O)-methyltransferase
MNTYGKPDFYAKKAKEEGYVARSIYKLKEIQEKFNLIKPNHKVLDLGCAPGSWSQYVSNLVTNNGLIVGIDYKKILVSMPNSIFITGSFYDEENIKKLQEYGPYDGIISDMAPDTVGDRIADCFNSSELVKHALLFSYDYLKKDGYFVAKIFQGGDEKKIILEMKGAFKEVKWFKPNSCRKISFEIFIIGKGFIKKPEIIKEEKSFELDNNSGEMPW